MLSFTLFLAILWGVILALILQRTAWGRFLALRRTWITVVIGVGVDLLILLAIIPFNAWIITCSIIAASSLGLIARSLINEHADERELLEAIDE
jgi:uncharacterized membrane protein